MTGVSSSSYSRPQELSHVHVTTPDPTEVGWCLKVAECTYEANFNWTVLRPSCR